MIRLIFVLLLFTACAKKPETLQPTVGKITESVYASGVIKSKNQYQVFPNVGGVVQNVLVKEGDLIKKGDPIMVIRNATPLLNTQNAALSADFAAANSKGDKLRELQSAIESARTKMINDSILLERQRGLWNQQIGSKVELEQRELAWTASKNNYLAAVYRLQDLRKQLDFAAAQSKKMLAISQSNAGDFTVRSQMDGRVYSISKTAGEVASVQSPVAVIGDAKTFVAELQVDENDIIRVKNGQRVLIAMSSYEGKAFEGTIITISPLMNERSRTFTVEAAFTQPPAVLYPNLTAEANIVILEKENALTIPRSWMIDDSLIILENKEKRKVTIGLKDYQKVEITSGLQAGETIIKPSK